MDILGKNLECVDEMCGKCPKNMSEASKFWKVSRKSPGCFQDVSRICRESIREVSKCSGCVQEVFRKCLVSVRKSTGSKLILIYVLFQH